MIKAIAGDFMKYNDHYVLSKYLVDMYGIDKGLNRTMYIIGNVMPDFDKLSYLQGYMRLKNRLLTFGRKLSLNDRRKLLIAGHTAEGSRYYVNRVSRKLVDKGKWNFYDWYRFGKSNHYVADRFTYPHTLRYTGGFFKHVAYEEILHTSFICLLGSIWERRCNVRDLIVKYFDNISLDRLYRAYRTEKPEAYNDCFYILVATSKYMGQVLKGKNTQ